MKKTLDVFLRALCTGFAIGIGGAVYLSCDNKYLGAFLFGTGLFTILTFGFNLFTVKSDTRSNANRLTYWNSSSCGSEISAALQFQLICCSIRVSLELLTRHGQCVR